MNRCGFKCAPSEIKEEFSNFRGNIEGTYTHFPRADEKDLTSTEVSFKRFLSDAAELEALLGKRLIKHSAATACALRLPMARLDRSRIGLALYGYLPENCTLPFSIKPVMSLTAPVISLKTVRKGEGVSYGSTPLERDTVIATVACGYANGLVRGAGRYLSPSINGNLVKIIGRVCMDRCMLDVTEIFEGGKGIAIYDGVEFFDNANAFSEAEGTIPYEILTRVGKMNTRNFIK
jgi:alanine racemase